MQALKGEINYGYGLACLSSFFQRKSDKLTGEVSKISLKADEKKLWEQVIFHDGTDEVL